MTRATLAPATPRKNRRSNWDRVERYRSRIADAYATARVFKQFSEAFSSAKGAIWDEINAQCTASERDYLAGYDRAKWEGISRELEWWLGDATGRQARTYAECVVPPTHGAHFWPDSLPGPAASPWSAWLPL